MRRSTLSCLVTAAVVASSGVFAQNAAQPADSQPRQPAPSAQSQPAPNAAADGRSTKAMQSGRDRRGPSSGNQVQAPSPDATPQGQRSASSSPSATETRPDARYPHPSGQDSQPDQSSRKTKLAAAGSKGDKEAGTEKTPQETRQSKQAAQLGKRKTYTGNSGSKADPSTACTTARPTVDGGVDCGTSGNSATLGKTVTKPH